MNKKLKEEIEEVNKLIETQQGDLKGKEKHDSVESKSKLEGSKEQLLLAESLKLNYEKILIKLLEDSKEAVFDIFKSTEGMELINLLVNNSAK